MKKLLLVLLFLILPSQSFSDGVTGMLKIAKGDIGGISTEHKFGRAPTGVQTTSTDIWDRADATPTQQIWVAPTQARVHNLVSTSTSDDGDPAGVGARTIEVCGLPDWDTLELCETKTMNGTTNVATSAFVIIHRLQVKTKGATSANVGVITVTAATDGTVTAQINVGEGQTQMAIYGIPSIQTAYVTQFFGSINKAQGAPASVNLRFIVNPEPDAELTNFIMKHIIGVQSTGTSHMMHAHIPYHPIPGPAIIKINAIASTADVEASAGFDLILIRSDFPYY